MKVFDQTRPNRPGYSAFDLSHSKSFTCNMGELIPVLIQDCIPGDRWQIGQECVVRFQPMVAPMLQRVDVYFHVFFCPYRLLWDDWENFISGGVDGDFSDPLPVWDPGVGKTALFSLWDYCGFPLAATDPVGFYPMDFVRRAYNRIFNEYYRDETNVDEVAESNEDILHRAWAKDYFTSALPWQQRGTAPAFPISGTTSAVFSGATWPDMPLRRDGLPNETITSKQAATRSGAVDLTLENAGSTPFSGKPVIVSSGNDTTDRQLEVQFPSTMNTLLGYNSVDFSDAVTFDVSDLRLAVQIQRWLELNARAGVRYTEFLSGHYGVKNGDDRLQRPEYVGGNRSPIIVSEVLQTGESGSTPQGNMAGHGLTVDVSRIGSYMCKEHGILMGFLSIMPEALYHQGINRQFVKSSKYDFYSPEFAHLSEQPILRGEIFTNNVEADNTAVFGYQGRWDEYRYVPSQVLSELRPGEDFDYWTLARDFATYPSLNSEFLTCTPSARSFAAPSARTCIVSVGNRLIARRPMPEISEPGLMDHV